jgi:hypothetical protein
MTASVMELDFTDAPDDSSGDRHGRRASSRINEPPVTEDGKLLTPKQIRARARRRAKRGGGKGKELLSQAEFNALYKPVEEWDLEELARGKPRNARGDFSGKTPNWVTRQVYEQAMDRFKNLVKEGLQANAVSALDTIEWILSDDSVDEKGKLNVPASTKLDAAKFLMEHVVGKPTQRVEGDISVKLQALLGVAMVNPADALTPSLGKPQFSLAHLPGQTMVMGEAEEGDDDILEGELVE